MSDKMYGIGYDEKLYATINEAVESVLYDCRWQPPSEFKKYSVTVKEYERVTAKMQAECLLEKVVEALDDDYSQSLEDYSEPTPAMLEAADKFCAAILAEYTPHDCEATGETQTLNALDWVIANRPEWMRETKGA